MSTRNRSAHTPAVVVGAGLNGLGVVRSLARSKVPVVLLDDDRAAPAMRSRFGRKHVIARDNEQSLVQALEYISTDYPGQRPVLFLTREHDVNTVADHRERLAKHYCLTLPNAHILKSLMHKDSVRRMAEAFGARIPKSIYVQEEVDISCITSMRPPLVIKPAVRDAEYTKIFNKAYRAKDLAEARELLERMLPVFSEIIVQEWIEGNDSDIYFCLQYLPPSGTTATSFVGRKIRSWPPRVGGTASCTAAPEAAELIDRTTDFFRYAGMTGLASMEYKRDSRTGEYIMVEPTVGRSDYQEEVATLNGVNIPYAAYCDTLGLSPPRACSYAFAQVWRDRESDMRSAAQDGDAHFPPKIRIVDALWRFYDPMPAMMPLIHQVRRGLKRIATFNTASARDRSGP